MKHEFYETLAFFININMVLCEFEFENLEDLTNIQKQATGNDIYQENQPSSLIESTDDSSSNNFSQGRTSGTRI